MARENRFDEDRSDEFEEGPSRRERSAKHKERKKHGPKKDGDGAPRARKQALRDRERMMEDWEDDVDDDEELEVPGADDADDEDEEDLDDLPDDVAAELWEDDWEDDDDDEDDDEDGGDWDEEESRWN